MKNKTELDVILDEIVMLIEDYIHHTAVGFAATKKGLMNLFDENTISKDEYIRLSKQNVERFEERSTDFIENVLPERMKRIKKRLSTLILNNLNETKRDSNNTII